MTRAALAVMAISAACSTPQPGLLELPVVALDGIGRQRRVEVIIDREEKTFVCTVFIGDWAADARLAKTQDHLDTMLAHQVQAAGREFVRGDSSTGSRLIVRIRADWFVSMGPIKRALEACARLGIHRIQFVVWGGDIDIPLLMSDTPLGDHDLSIHLVARKSGVVYKMGGSEFKSLPALREGLRKTWAEWGVREPAATTVVRLKAGAKVPYYRFIYVVELLDPLHRKLVMGAPTIRTGRKKRDD